MEIRSPTDKTTEEIQKLNLIRERLSDIVSAIVVELEVHREHVDPVVILQNMLIAVERVPIPDVSTQNIMVEIKNDIVRQIRDYLQRKLEEEES
jgi:hypothetical protein